MSVKVVSFEYCDKNNTVYISKMFNCHEQLVLQNLTNRDVSYNKRCETYEVSHLNNITHGIIKCYEFMEFMNDIINNCDVKLVDMSNFDNKTEFINDDYDNDKYYIQIVLNEKFKLNDFINSVFRHAYTITFYNDNNEFSIMF